jgi:hypothetical protein
LQAPGGARPIYQGYGKITSKATMTFTIMMTMQQCMDLRSMLLKIPGQHHHFDNWLPKIQKKMKQIALL